MKIDINASCKIKYDNYPALKLDVGIVKSDAINIFCIITLYKLDITIGITI